MSIQIGSIKQVIEDHLCELRTVSDVAKAADVSCETLKKTFRRAVGIPLSNYIIDVRISRMKDLLAHQNLSCFQICYNVGFKREDTGSKVFKRKMGMTMLEYRRRFSNGATPSESSH